jgi:hypothetical protein
MHSSTRGLQNRMSALASDVVRPAASRYVSDKVLTREVSRTCASRGGIASVKIQC